MRITRNMCLYIIVAILNCIPCICSAADGGRVLRFPANRSLGKIKVMDVDEQRTIQISHYIDSIGDCDWHLWRVADYYSEARGNVVIPAGKKVALFLYVDALKDLSPLENLKPDDLHMLTHELSDFRTKTPLTAKTMEHISHLTGLKDFRLFQTSAATSSMKYIIKLQSLQTLHPPQGLTNKGLLYIAQLKSLKRLVLAYPDGNRVTNKGLNHCLPKLTELEELTLIGRYISDAGLEFLADMPNLAYLSLRSGNYTNAAVPHIQKCPSLRVLDLGFLPITDDGLKHLSGHSGLQALYLLGTDITDRGLGLLQALPNLNKLNISKTPRQDQITDTGMSHLGRIGSLEYLQLPAFGITDKGVASLANLKKLEHLSVCSSTSSPLTDNALKNISKLKSLELLVIGGNFTDLGLEAISGLNDLRELRLISDTIPDKGLAKLTSLQNLEKFSIYCENISISGVSSLNALKNLSELSAENIRQDNSGLNISCLTKLERLKLSTLNSSGKITDADLVSLDALKHLKSFVINSSINTNQTGITGKGMKNLSGLTNLQTLCLGGPDLKDEDFRYFKHMNNLMYLIVHGGSLTDDCLRHLEALPKLRTLTIYHENDISDQALELLNNKIPKLKIKIVRNENKD